MVEHAHKKTMNMVLLLKVKAKQQRYAAICKLVECLGKGNRVF